MENFKMWKTVKHGSYTFEIDSKIIGNLEVIYDSINRKALFNVENKVFTLKYTGFWKSNFIITDETESIIMTSHPEKWYASTTILEYKGKQFKLKIRNNPMAEYALFDGENVILTYGLCTENKKASIRIHSNLQDNNPLFDFILWYNFLPIAIENIGHDFTFQSLLLSSQV